MYSLITQHEREKVCFVETNNRIKERGSIRTVSPEAIDPDEITKILIPTYGIPLEKAIYRRVRDISGLGAEKIWNTDKDSFARCLVKYGSLDAFISSDTIPYIHVLEYEAAHHCNLKCKGCSHFSPLTEPKFGNIGSFTRDLERLSSFKSKVLDISMREINENRTGIKINYNGIKKGKAIEGFEFRVKKEEDFDEYNMG